MSIDYYIENVYCDISIVIPVLDEPYLNELRRNIMYELRNHGKVEIIIDESKGCGNAILNGIRKSNGGIIVVMDGDGSHNPKYLRYLITDIYNSSDIAYGIKKVNKDSLYRQIITKTFDILARILIKDYPDLMSGFFAFKKELKNSLPETINHPKVLMKLIQNNPKAKVSFIDIIFEKRKGGESKLGKPSIAYEIIKDMIIDKFIKNNNIDNVA